MAIPSWLHLSQVSGSGDTIITITADSYYQIAERIDSLLISGHTKHVEVEVKQSGTPIGVTPDVITLGSVSTHATVSVTSMGPWEMSGFSDDTWLTWSQTAGTSGTTVVSFTATTNSTGFDRVAHVNFCTSGICVPLTVTQTVIEDWDVVAHFTGDSAYVCSAGGLKLLDDYIEVDGVVQPLTRSVSFSGSGDHVVKYKTYVPHVLGHTTFTGCTNMTSCELLSSVHILERSVFDYCSNLTALTLNEGLVKIGGSVLIDEITTGVGPSFTGCTGITSLVIPSTVSDIASVSFQCLTGLQSITFNCKEIRGYYLDFANVVNITLAEDTCYCTTYSNGNYGGPSEVYNNVRYIGPIAVGTSDNSYTSYTLRPGTIAIDGPGFSGCRNMTGLTTPSSLLFVGEETFIGCSSLTVDNGVVYAGDIAVEFTTGGTSGNQAVLKDGTRILATQTNEVKKRNNNITSISLPSSLVSICRYPLGSNVTDISLPSTVKYFNSEHYIPTKTTSFTYTNETKFYGTGSTVSRQSGLSRDYVGNIYSDTVFYWGDKNAAHVTIPSGIKTIQPYAFIQHTNLTGVTIPDTVETIGLGAFDGCTALSSVTIPSSVTSMTSAFEQCTSLTAITYVNPHVEYYIPEYFTGQANPRIPDSMYYSIRGVATLAQFNIALGENIKFIGKRDAMTATTINAYCNQEPRLYDNRIFSGSTRNGTIHHKDGVDFSQWLSNSAYYLGYYGWTDSADL